MSNADHAAALTELLGLVDERYQAALRAGIDGLADTGRLDKVERWKLDIETDIEAGWLVVGVDVVEGETIRAAIDAYDDGSGAPE